MIKFFTPPAWFSYSGLLLLVFQLFLFIFSIYPFQAGTWYNTEPAMTTLFIFSAINCSWLALGISKKWLVIELPIHPLVYVLLAWACVQLLPFFTSNNPIHSWMGIPQTGEGGAWQVMLVLTVFFAMPLWQVANHRKILLSSGVLSLCIMSYLQFDVKLICPSSIRDYRPHLMPSVFPDYLPFIAAWLWIAYASSPALRTPARHFWMVFISCLTIYIGNSLSSYYILYPLFIGLGVVLLLQIWRKKPIWIAKISTPTKKWRALAIAGILLPLCWTFAPLKQELLACNNSSIAIRKVINEISLSTIFNEPSRIVFGNGWGNFKNDVYKYAMVDSVHAFKNGEFSPNFIWLNGNVFHPHNQPVAALFALGVIGFIIFMALPIFALANLRKSLFWWCAPILIGINAIGVMWFTIPQVLPFQALGFTALCAGRKISSAAIKYIPKYIAIICVILSLLLTVSAWKQLHFISYSERLKNIMDEDPTQKDIVNWIAQDIPDSGERMVQAILYFANNIAIKVSTNSATETDRDWYKNFLEIAHKAATYENASLEMTKLEPNLSMMLFKLANPSPLDELKPSAKNMLLDSIITLSKKAPMREDEIAFFLMSLDGFTGGNVTEQKEILQKILDVAPQHRSALWLLGILENNEEMKKQAALLGVEKIYPVNNEQLAIYK